MTYIFSFSVCSEVQRFTNGSIQLERQFGRILQIYRGGNLLDLIPV